MSGDDNDDMWFQRRNGSIMNCPSSGMSTNPLTQKVSGMTLNSVSTPSVVDHFFGSGWDPIASLSHDENFGVSAMVSHSEFVTSPYSVAMENQGINSTSNLVQYLSDPSFVELVPKIPRFGSGNFSEMVSSFSLPENSQIANSGCPSNKDGGNVRASVNVSQSYEDLQISEEMAIGVSTNGKTGKRAPDPTSLFNPKKNTEVELPKDSSGDSTGALKEQDDKKQKIKQNAGAHLRGKQAAKQAEDSSHSGEAQREYIHVRAKRGQATNSHSLAERVRREKISERMRLLQELVPGCNKITGKAVMLDEIINYVQSLQQQVEFLSMKLATVNPELNVDIERILSKDILHSRSGGAALLRFSSGMNCSQPYQPEIFQGTMPSIPSANPQFPPMPPSVLDHEFQSLYQMGFDSSSAIDSLGQNAGRLKSEL